MYKPGKPGKPGKLETYGFYNHRLIVLNIEEMAHTKTIQIL